MRNSTVFVAALLLLLAASGTAAHAERPLFVEPPSPETLASLFLPRRYRSVDASTATAQADTTGFGMMIHFDLDSAAIVPESLPLLESVGQMLLLEQVGERVVMIAGHADARGTPEYNQALSERRAQAIKSYLVESFGIVPERLMTVGYGEAHLHAQHDPLSRLNRRVEFSEAAGISIR